MIDLRESGCARLCLLTRAAWEQDMPLPLGRSTVARMIASGELEALVLREDVFMPEALAERARALLSRTAAVHARMCAYEQAGFRLMLPEEAGWPEALRKLGVHMPLFLFARGSEALLSRRMIAVAGSRRIRIRTRRTAERVGEMIAAEKWVLVTGGASGVDEYAAQAAIRAGGSVVLVPALAQHEILRRTWVDGALEEGRLLILYDSLPDEAFSAAKALERNHAIYALGEAAIVVASRAGVGGSWRGAKDCLRGGWTPVYACSGEGEDFEGNRALLGEGAYALDPGAGTLGGQLCAVRQMEMGV